MVLSGCNSAPPANLGDVCSIFTERTNWYRAAKAAEERWQTPIALNMAIIYQESSFRSRARPARERFLWVFPGARPSSAFGYAQALESTWQEYQLRSGNDTASRSDFADAVDFVAWYTANSRRISGIKATDARSLYFAYHEGNAGFQRGRHLRKRWLIQAADQVQQNSEKFGRQLDRCHAEFEKAGLKNCSVQPAIILAGKQLRGVCLELVGKDCWRHIRLYDGWASWCCHGGSTRELL